MRPGQNNKDEDGRQPPDRTQIEAFCKVTADRVKVALEREEVNGDGVWEY